MLDRWGHLEDIPDGSARPGTPACASAAKLNATLREQFELALLFRRIATVETDADVGTVDEWRVDRAPPGVRQGRRRARIAPQLAERAQKLVDRLG